MITAIDFGCYAIRSAFREEKIGAPVTMYSEKSEYIVLPNIERYRRLLDEHQVARAECEDTLVVYGSQASQTRWLSRMPSASMFSGGVVPADDPPARQMLDLICAAILPTPTSGRNLCAFIVPGSERTEASREFLARLIRMRGFEPFPVDAAEATILAEGSETSFSGVSVVIGAETSHICISRLGVTLVSTSIPVGADWVDIELARQFQIQVFDEEGTAWLDLEAVREWKHSSERNLRTPVGEREKVLSRLYLAVLDQIAQATQRLLSSPTVKARIGAERLHVICAGGAIQIAGFASALTERFVDHGIAGQIQSVRTVDRPDQTIVRGALIAGELEVRSRRTAQAA
jgi:hypothetical protein